MNNIIEVLKKKKSWTAPLPLMWGGGGLSSPLVLGRVPVCDIIFRSTLLAPTFNSPLSEFKITNNQSQLGPGGGSLPPYSSRLSKYTLYYSTSEALI